MGSVLLKASREGPPHLAVGLVDLAVVLEESIVLVQVNLHSSRATLKFLVVFGERGLVGMEASASHVRHLLPLLLLHWLLLGLVDCSLVAQVAVAKWIDWLPLI